MKPGSSASSPRKGLFTVVAKKVSMGSNETPVLNTRVSIRRMSDRQASALAEEP